MSNGKLAAGGEGRLLNSGEVIVESESTCAEMGFNCIFENQRVLSFLDKPVSISRLENSMWDASSPLGTISSP